jgi:hypothetical protein
MGKRCGSEVHTNLRQSTDFQSTRVSVAAGCRSRQLSVREFSDHLVNCAINKKKNTERVF